MFQRISRRRFILGAAAAAGAGLFYFRPRNPISRLAPFVRPAETWSGTQLSDFLRELPPAAMLNLKKGQGLLPPDATIAALKGPSEDLSDIRKHALWLSSSILTVGFRDEKRLSWHEVVTWAAKKLGVPGQVDSKPTFLVEREVQKAMFSKLWDKMSFEQRLTVLKTVDSHGDIKDKAAVAAMAGSGALAALSVTVAFSGFAFYTTMSVAISTLATGVGLTLPFATYTGASSAVCLLSGPVGWVCAGGLAVLGVAIAGAPNAEKTAGLIAQIHSIKIDALVAAGQARDEIFA